MIPFIYKSDKPIGGKANGRNYLTHIAMWTGAKDYLAVQAQEVFEWRFKTRRALTAAALPSVLLWVFVPGHWAALLALTFFIYLISWVLMRKIGLVEMELRGHAIEIAAAVDPYDRLYEVKLEEEAHALDVHYGQFNGWTRQDIRKALMSYGPWALKVYPKYT